MFQAALTTHDIDADSAIWTCSSVITDDRSSCRFSDDEEVSKCVYVNATIVSENVQKQIIFVLWSLSSKSSSVMSAVHVQL